MNILSHGIPFCCDSTPIDRYRGAHRLRSFGFQAEAEIRYEPAADSLDDILNRLGQEEAPDLILFWLPEIFPPPMGVERAPVPTVALISDWNLFYPVLARNLARYDVVLCDKRGVDTLASEWVQPAHVFPLYSQITGVHRPGAGPRDIDIVFAGNVSVATHLERGRYLERLTRLARQYRVVVTSDLACEPYGRLLGRSRIVFNHSIRGELNLRVFESMACGALALLEEDNAEVRAWFEDGKDLVLYNTGNFEERLRYYLEHPVEAEAIATRGQARAAEWAGEHRFDALIEAALPLARAGTGRRFLDLPAEEQAYQTFLMYAYSRWPAYHPIEEGMLAGLLKSAPRDPRTWTALGRHVANAYSHAGDETQRGERLLKAFLNAHRLAPDSAPYALNAASAFRAQNRPQEEAEYLARAIEKTSLEGAEFLIGSHQNAFWVRWMRAVAERRASIDMLHAECHVRLARLLARDSLHESAEAHLARAAELDPANSGGVTFLAELRWADGRREDAAATLLSCLEAFPLDVPFRERLRDMLRHLGRDEEAQRIEEELECIRLALRPASDFMR